MAKSLVLGLGVLGFAAGSAFFATRPAAAGADGDRDQVELGRRLFFDPALGRRGRVGCADCHQPEHGFSDARPRSVDEDRTLARHSQPVTDLGGAGFHWDGEFDTVRELIDSRTLPVAAAQKVEQERSARRIAAARTANHADADDTSGGYSGGGRPMSLSDFFLRTTPVAARLAEDGRYDEGFLRAYGDAAVTPQRVGDAVEAYLRTVRTSDNELDRRLRGDIAAMSPAAERGLVLFRGKAGCAECHVLETVDGRTLLTDGKFHNTGVSTRASADQRTLVNVGRRTIVKEGSDLGRLSRTHDPADVGRFKTPSLRDVARRAPYMHDASLATLREVVDYYDGGGTANANLDRRIHELRLADTEKDDLVAFLESLTGDVRAGVGPLTPAHVETLHVHVEALDGTPLANVELDAWPCGDRLGDAAQTPRCASVTTDAAGDAVIPFPAWTHVRIESDGYELGLSRPIPDWVSRTTLIATPGEQVSVRIRHGDALPVLPPKLLLRQTNPSFCFVDGKALLCDPAAKPVELTFVRRLSEDEDLYAAPTPRPASAKLAAMSLCIDGRDEPIGTFEVDLLGGASETIDLASAERVSTFDLPEGLRRRMAPPTK